jgi:hypothetical protein
MDSALVNEYFEQRQCLRIKRLTINNVVNQKHTVCSVMIHVMSDFEAGDSAL